MEPSSAPWRVIEEAAPEREHEERSETSGPRRRWVLFAAALVLTAAAALLFAATAREDPVVSAGGLPDPAASETASGSASAGVSGVGGAVLVVEVSGAVARPGVYRLAPGSRVGDAVEAAGGYSPRIDPAAADHALNLAQRLQDGDKIHVPSRDEAAAPEGSGAPPGAAGGGSAAGSSGALVDLNHASAEALDALPGIGPATAAKIIAARTERPFASLDELVARKVLAQSVLAKIRALVTVGG